MKSKSRILLISTIIIFVLTIFIGTSYSLWQAINTQKDSNVVTTSCFDIEFRDGNNINIENAYPISDEKGLQKIPYNLKLKSNCELGSSFKIVVNPLKSNTLDSQFIKLAIKENDNLKFAPKTINELQVNNEYDISKYSSSYTILEDNLYSKQEKEYKIYLWMNIDATNSEMNKTFKANFMIINTANSDIVSLDKKILNNNGGKEYIENKGNPDFSKTSVTQAYYDKLEDKTNYTVDTGMYSTEDDYGTSYYFRGAVDNNNVIFANFCWQIIRITGNNSIRLIYNGIPDNGTCPKVYGSDSGISSGIFNNSNDNAYVGYMYGTVGSDNYNDTHANLNSSNAKNKVDTWFENNLKEYQSLLTDTLFCGDRSIADKEGYWSSDDTAKGYGKEVTYYGAYARSNFSNNPELKNKPTLKCLNKNDRYTVNDSNIGNANLTYPIALINADEIALAGGLGDVDNKGFYLYTDAYTVSMSASYFFSSKPRVIFINRTGSFSVGSKTFTNNGSFILRPIINLTPYIQTTGNGTVNDPFVVKTE